MTDLIECCNILEENDDNEEIKRRENVDTILS